jgi:hypothetical protein
MPLHWAAFLPASRAISSIGMGCGLRARRTRADWSPGNGPSRKSGSQLAIIRPAARCVAAIFFGRDGRHLDAPPCWRSPAGKPRMLAVPNRSGRRAKVRGRYSVHAPDASGRGVPRF